MGFSEKLAEKINKSKTSLCLGIDPHARDFSPQLKALISTHGAEAILSEICIASTDAASKYLSSVKFQMSFFECHGDEGIRALKNSVAYASSKGLTTILDAKRGDISSTMHAYGEMAYDYIKADALTVLPYMGLAVVDALVPWLAKGSGVYVVWVSSNPEGWSVQKSVHAQLLQDLEAWSDRKKMKSSVGLVLGSTMVGAVDPLVLERAMPFPLLLPGFGAQGAQMDSATIAVLKKSTAPLFPMSRGLLDTSVLKPQSKKELYEAVFEAVESRTCAEYLNFSPIP